jgi:glucan 1,3-beta-glucosidase
VHLLPYWENKPTGIDGALAEAASMYGEATVTFPGRRVFIGETGWPSRGRQREDARPSVVGQARFVREFTQWAHTHAVHYNLIEAFDQPWKRAQEGTVGGFWGLYDKHGRAKFALQGPLQADPMWHQGPIDALLCAALFGGLGLLRRRSGKHCDLLLMALCGAALGPLLPLQWQYLSDTSRTFQELILGGGVTLIGTVLALWLVLAAAGRHSDSAVTVPDGIGETLRGFNRRSLPQRPEQGHSRLLGLLRLALLIGLTYVCLGLALDPRYRGFPMPLYLLPLAVVSALALCEPRGWRLRWPQMAEEVALAAVCGVSAVIWALREGPLNLPSLAWSGLVLLFCVSQLAGLRRQRTGQHQ